MKAGSVHNGSVCGDEDEAGVNPTGEGLEPEEAVENKAVEETPEKEEGSVEQNNGEEASQSEKASSVTLGINKKGSVMEVEDANGEKQTVALTKNPENNLTGRKSDSSNKTPTKKPRLELGGSKIKTEPSMDAEASNADDSTRRCRICLGGNNLTDIFAADESSTVATNIMILCPTVKIAKKDMMPQFICDVCLQSLRVAINFKTLGETTDKELRSTVKQKRKTLKETEFVVIDCNDEGGEVEENINFFSDDDEFHPPTDYNVTESNSDSDSSFGVKKTRGRRSLRKRRRRTKRTVSQISSSPRMTRQKRRGRSARKETADEGTDNESSKAIKAAKPGQCVYCDLTFPSLIALREHKRTHVGEKPFKCDVCDRTFKFIGSFKTHQEKHKIPDDLMCGQCNKRYPNKTELRKHLVDVHDEPVAKYVCPKCKRAFTSEKRLDRHKESNCPGVETPQGKEKKSKPEPDSIALGRDLFKCVAPLTTTYWSDSFSD